ncbi:T9SS type B sorting domain-containing protein [Flavobacterium sp. GCM10023249]|uniref:T9SS type B sorting domain-containing protein n=1 Tax=unclassified Flavobacterium TaxID=196869 RepID=UPI0036179FB2
MKLKIYSLFAILLLFNSIALAQNLKPFTPRFDQDLKGDILLIGNNTINRSTGSNGPNVPYNGTGQNGSINMGFIDVDSDPSTFSSSSANLVIPPTSASCYRIRYAGLYWAGILQSNTRTGINQVKLKLPGSSTYTDITGTIVHDDPNAPIGTDQNKVYACYYDITSLVTGLTNPQGTYTVANVLSSTGSNGGTGLSAGWSIFIVYEDPLLPSKSIVTFDGFSGIGGATTLDIPITGFRTIPAGPVRAKFAFSCLEGDYDITGDYLRINGTTISTTAGTRPRLLNNFFNSTITDLNGIAATRNPASDNTLGYDAGIITNFNPSNSVLANNATSATIRLGSTQDVFFYFFNAFAVDIIEPQIVLTKTVEDSAGNPVADGSAVNLGQYLTYVIGFQNIGNDDATNVIIRDVLPVNVIYNHPADLILPPGVTVASYNPTTREIRFNVDPSIVNVGDPRSVIRIRVRVVENCYELVDACENRIINQAFASYQGVINTTPITDDPSLSSFTACNLGTPSPTNFIGNIDDCVYSQNVILCGASVQLTAPSGYTTYTWSGPAPVTPVGGQVVTVTQPGTYTVMCNAPDPCIDIPVTFNVITFGAGVTNPVLPYADEIVICPNDGEQLPYIYLCGATDSETILTNIADATSITWMKLNEPCATTLPPTCANTGACTWPTVGTGPNFTVTDAGQYKIVITYPGNNCQSVFYFNVFKNLLDPQAVATDIICTTPGCITVNNVPSSGYEFSLSTPAGAQTGVWQTSNVFCNIMTAGNYTVFIRQTGFTNGCLFSVPNVQVRLRNFTVTANVTQPLCFGDRGSITLGVNDVNPQYYFELHSGASPAGPLVASAGPQASNTYTFPNLTPGQTYTWVVRTDNGCTQNATFTINNPAQLVATSALTRPLSCNPGEVTITATGGTPPYAYYVNTTPPAGAFQTSNVITVNTPGTYTTTVVDANNCQAVTTIVVNQVQPPVYTVASTNILCNGANNGTITFNVTNANGNALQYSINNGTTWSNSNVFTGLAAGTYTAVVQYTTGTAVCTTTPQTITITNPSPLTIAAVLDPQITCVAPGVITVTASGGTGALQYSIDGINFQSSNVFNITVGGTYTVTVRDINNCTRTTTVTAVTPVGPSDLYLKDQVKVSCENVTGQLNVDVVPGFGGQPPLRFQIIAPITSTVQADGNFSGLSPGAYTFEVTDRNGCKYQEVFILESVAPPVITPQLINDVRCFGTSTGNASFTITGLPNRADYSYTITPSPGTSGSGTTPNSGSTTLTIPLNNYPAGTYTLTLIYETCTITNTVTIGGPASALVANLVTTPVTCSSNGSITVNATGGWGAYTYTISPVAGSQSGNVFTNVPAGTYTITTTDANGCQDVDTVTFTTPVRPTLTLNATSDFCYDTTNGATLIVTASGGVAPYEFSINGGAFVAGNTSSPANSHTYANLTPGTYTIVVRDAYGCTNAAAFTQTINPQLTINASLTKDFDCSASPNGTISVTAANGYPGYTFQVNINNTGYTAITPAPVGNPFTYTVPVANPGTYQFQVTDTRGCIAQSGVITIPALTLPTATHVATNVTCNGLSNGSVTITPSSGTAPYVISFNGSAFTATTTYSGLAAGTYNYIVRDAKQCTFNGSVTITQPTAITVSAALTTPYTCSSNGIITVTASGGTGTLSYSINGTTFQAGNTFTVTSAGTYTITVRDTNGCTATTSVIVSPLTPPTDITFSATAVTCTSGNTSNVTLTVTGGSAPLTYQIIAPTVVAPQASNVFNNLAPGTYTFLVTDSRNCNYQESFTISPLPALTVSAVVNSNIQCAGSATGSIRFTVSGFSPTYNYTITPNGFPGDSGTNIGTSSVTVNNLTANTYTINVVNPTTGCTASTTVTISGPASPLTATLTTTPVTCAINGTVTVNASGGWGSYTYAISPIAGTQAGNTFTNIPAGSYNITIVDANGCSITRPFTLTAPVQPNIALSATSDFCYDTTNGASLVVVGSGGVAPYSFSINGGAFNPSNTPVNSHTFSNLTPGTYTIAVRDSFGCINAVPFTQTINPQLTLNTVLTKDFDCTASPNAVITANITGGYPGYTYQVSYNAGAFSAPVAVAGSNITYTVSTANPGTYVIRVTDSRGCVVQSGVITIPPLVPVTVSTTQVNVLCFGDATGSVTFTPGGGIGPYQINFNGGGFTSNFTYSNLAAGTYTYVVRDTKMCTVSGSVTITQNPQINYTITTVPIQCTAGGTVLGQICVQGVSGGVAPYVYTLTDLSNGNPPQTFNAATAGINHCFTNLDFGFYDVTVTDANGCQITNSNIAIASPVSGLDITTTVLPPGDCLSGASVVVNAVSTFGAGGPYYFSLYPTSTLPPAGAGWQPESPLGSGTSTFTGLLTGVTYSFVVWDQSSNCYYYAQADTSTASNSNMTTSTLVVNNVTCRGSADANVSVTINNYSGTSVSWTVYNSVTLAPVVGPTNVVGLPGGAFTINNIGPLAPGSYFVLLTETSGPNNGCSVSTPVFNVVESLTPLTIVASAIKNDNCNPNAGVITASGQGGTAPYTYSLDGVTFNTPNTFNVESGTYTVYVRDAYGCTVSTTVTVNLDATPNIDVTLINACAAEGNFSLNVTLNTVGVAPYSLSLDGGAFQTVTFPYMINGLSSGAHTVVVQDSNGCGETVNINILTPLSGASVISALPTCANNDGVIVITPNGGSGNYSYSITPVAGSITGTNPATISGLPAGNYTVTITDTTTSCTFNIPVTLGAPTPVSFSATSTDVSCNGGSDGTITVTLNPGNDNPVYTYQIISPAIGPQTSNVFTGLPVGTYTVQVNSGRGCSLQQNVVVNEPSAVTASASATAFTCAPDNSENTATITVVGGGGTTPYTYSIDGTNYFTGNTFQVVNTNVDQTFTVYVKDNNGCIATNTITVNRLPRLVSATINQVTAITCTNPEVVNVTVVGGSGTFTYQLLPSGTPQASNIFNLPAPGTYTIQVNDVTTGCTIQATYTVSPFNTLDVTGTLVNGVSCLGGTNGAISINVTGYSGAYNYTVFDAVGTPVAGGAGNTVTNPFTIPTGLPAGNYTVQITETATPFCQDTTGVINVTTPGTAVGIQLVSNINANCNANAQVTVIGTGGTPGYTYAFMQNGVAPTPADFAAANSASLNPLTNTQWDVWVQDANGCRAMLDVTITTDPTPTVTAPNFAADQCTSTGASYTFTVVGTGVAPLTYSIGGAFQNSPTFTVVASATPYTVTVRDANGCTATDTILIYPALGVTTSITALPSCANNDGSITINANGGSGNYSYSITPVVGIIAGNTITGLPAGTYTVTVTDTTTSCTATTTFTLGAPTPVTFTLASTPVSCFGGNNGTITVALDASNDNPVYTYQIIAGPGAPIPAVPQTSNVFTGLVTGLYTVQVNSGRGCSATQTITVNQPTDLVIDSVVVAPFTCAMNNTTNVATITVTASGGTTPYTYSIDGTNYTASNVFQIADNGSVQNFTVYVKDFNACIETSTATVNPIVPLTATTSTVTIDCTRPETVTVTASGGSGSYTYSYLPASAANITQGIAPNDNVFTITAPGSYYLRVTDAVTGCYLDLPVYGITPFNTIVVDATAVSPVTCFGGTNGSISINVTGYTGAYSYQVLDSTNTAVLSGTGNTSTNPLTIAGLTGGSYTVLVTESATPFCSATSNSVTVATPSLPLDITAQETANVTCDNNQGVIVATATGGWDTNYTYTINSLPAGATQTNNVFSGMPAGTYTITVTDANGCTDNVTITLVRPTQITANAIATQTVNCFGDQNMTITVTGVTGGQGSNYTYTLNTLTPVVSSSGPQSSNVFSNLGAGTYEVIINDGYNCASNPIPVTILPRTQVQATVAMVANSQQCADSSASLTITASGGVAPYSYSTSATGPFTGSFNPSITLTNVPVGTHSYYVQDANGCISFVTNEVKIDQLEPLTLSISANTDTVINCFGDNDANIHVLASGGIGGYQYTLTGPSGTVGPQTNGDFLNLTAGNYVVSVISGNCTPVTRNITITEPTQPFAVVFTPSDAKCFGEPNGTITMTFSGYRGTVQFNIRPQGTTDPVETFTVTNPAQPYVITGLYGGVTYVVNVIDQDFGCSVQSIVTVGQPLAPLNASATGFMDEECSEQDLGSIDVAITGGTGPYSLHYEVLYPGSSTPVIGSTVNLPLGTSTYQFANLNGGIYVIYVNDANGCATNFDQIIGSGDSFDAVALVEEECYNNTPGVKVTVLNTLTTNNTFGPGYTFALGAFPAQSSPVFESTNPVYGATLLAGGNFTITVTGPNACQKDTPQFTITPVLPLQVTLAQTALNTVTATAVGGSGNYTYVFYLNGNVGQSGSENVFVYRESGTVTVEVTDSSGCNATANIPVTFVPICIPDVFTPDGNGNNDTWEPGCADIYPNLKTRIYDRYGRQVAELKQGQSWDGKYEGKELPSGDYWYVIKINGNDDDEFVGHFTLYR